MHALFISLRHYPGIAADEVPFPSREMSLVVAKLAPWKCLLQGLCLLCLFWTNAATLGKRAMSLRCTIWDAALQTSAHLNC